MSRIVVEHALRLHRQGDLAQAEPLYLQALKANPQEFGALHYLGVLRAQQGRHTEAIDLLAAALRVNPRDFSALSNYVMALMAAGHHAQAAETYGQILAVNPDLIEAHFHRGIALANLGQHDAALASFDQVIARKVDHAQAHYNRGVALANLGQSEEALASYDAALALEPEMAQAWDNRGNVLLLLQRHADALASYDQAVARAPKRSAAFFNRGICLAVMNRPEDAAASYDAALVLQPQYPQALFNRGLSLMTLKRFDAALDSFDRALALAPDAGTLNNRGVVLWHLGRPQDAMQSYDRSLALDPRHAATRVNRAFLLHETGNYDAALAQYDLALTIEPDNARAWDGRGVVLRGLRRPAEALASFDKAVALAPIFAEALANRATLRWEEQNALEPAMDDMARAVAADPAQPYLAGELLHLKMHGADWRDFDAQKAALDAGIRSGARVARPFVYQALGDNPADLQACSRIFARDVVPVVGAPAPHPARNPDRIRIGYVSGEFREQATAYLMARLYELHDRARFEIIAFDNGVRDASPMRARLEAAFDRFIPIAELPDAAAAALIRAQEIDILVNLNGYFGAPRMGVFARRPAPVQVNYLGFPATLGSSCMDYIIADATVIPHSDTRYYDEAVVRLPHSYQANDDRRLIAAETTRRAEGLPDGGVVFCNFNQSYKLTPPTFAAWMRILTQVENSVLWLLDGTATLRENLRREAGQQGVAANRLVFAPPLPLTRHLARLKLADLFLDTLPYNAHTTASDALWAGVPLLTCRGTAFPGRVAASLLGAANLPELVTDSMGEYEKLAIALGHDITARAALKAKLADHRATCPLFDSDRFRRHIEAAYLTMWKTWQAGAPAQGFDVPPQTM